MSKLKSTPGNYSTLIKATTETAFQRAIILGKTSIIDNEIVEWLDIELPVDKNRKARGHCVDLIGRDANGYIICELKFGNNSATDSPNDAAAEIARYLDDIKTNYTELDNCNIHHKNGIPFLWQDIACSARFIIAANHDYWKYWLEHREYDIPQNFDCYSIDIDVKCFKQQKLQKDSYTPQLPECSWVKLNK